MPAGSSPLTRPRGRLPARVYWFRRGLVLGTPVLLVIGFAHLLGGGGGSTPPKAQLADAGTSTHSTPSSPHPSGPTVTGHAPITPSSTPLAIPDGPCKTDDLSVQPAVPHPLAGGPVVIQIQVSTTRDACTFTASPTTLAVKVTSGSDRVWSSQDCHPAVPTRSLIVRSSTPVTVPVSWNGRRSVPGSCNDTQAWARAGYYHALAAVIGSTPADVQFRLSVPPRPVVTKTAKPKTDPKSSPKSNRAPSSGSSGSGAQGKGTKCGGDNTASSC
jgi:hypothetical protein